MGSIIAQEAIKRDYDTLYLMGGERRQEFMEQRLCLAQVESVQLVDMADYRACIGEVDWESVRGQPCIVAIDMAAGGLSESIDLVSIAWGVWQGDCLLVGLRHLLPGGQKAGDIGRRRNLPLTEWMRTRAVLDGGERALDFSLVTAQVEQLASRFAVKVLAVDPVTRQAAQIEREWLPRWPVERVPQTIVHMSPAWGLCLDMLRKRQLRLPADPVLELSLTQTRAVVTTSGLVRPVKDTEHGLSDPVMALTMLVGVAARHRAAGDYHSPAQIVC